MKKYLVEIHDAGATNMPGDLVHKYLYSSLKDAEDSLKEYFDEEQLVKEEDKKDGINPWDDIAGNWQRIGTYVIDDEIYAIIDEINADE